MPHIVVTMFTSVSDTDLLSLPSCHRKWKDGESDTATCSYFYTSVNVCRAACSRAREDRANDQAATRSRHRQEVVFLPKLQSVSPPIPHQTQRPGWYWSKSAHLWGYCHQGEWACVLSTFLNRKAQRMYYSLQALQKDDYEMLKMEILVGISNFQWSYSENVPIRVQATQLMRLTPVAFLWESHCHPSCWESADWPSARGTSLPVQGAWETNQPSLNWLRR